MVEQVVTWILLLAMGQALRSGEPWKEVKREGEIVVDARKVSDADVRELRATTIMPYAPERIYRVITDIGDFPQFMPGVEKVRVLRRSGDTMFVYFRLDIPYLADRDYTVRQVDVSVPSGHIYHLVWMQANAAGPAPQDGVVRMRTVRGSWFVEPVGSGRRSRVTYTVLADPRSSLPSWIVGRGSVEAAIKTLQAVEEQAAQQRYAADRRQPIRGRRSVPPSPPLRRTRRALSSSEPSRRRTPREGAVSAQSKFWDTIRTELQPISDEQMHAAAYAVLHHLRDRINPGEAIHLVQAAHDRLGIDAEEIGGRIEAGRQGTTAAAPTEKSSPAEFVEEVRRDAHLRDHATAEQATRAVFHGLRSALPRPDQDRLYPQLPPGLQELWR